MLNLKNTRFVAVAMSLALMSLGTTGCGSGSNKNPSIAGIKYNASYVNNYFMLSTTFTQLRLDGGGRFAFDKKLPNSYLEIGPDFQSNGTLVTVALASADITAAGGLHSFDPTTLPGGRPLPGVADGQLPGVAIQIQKLGNIALYFGGGAFGVFVPVSLGVKDAIATFRFYADGQRVGNISLVGSDASGKNAGFLVLIQKTMVNQALGKSVL